MKIIRRTVSAVLALMILIMLNTQVFAVQTEKNEDFTYKVLQDNTAEITGYLGDDTDVVIPESLEGHTVVSIGDFAFNDCGNLQTVVFNESLESIGEGAFYECRSMREVFIPSGIKSIGNWAFYDCDDIVSIEVDGNNKFYDSRNDCNAIIETSSNTLLLGCGNTEIPDTVTSIGEDAFMGNKALTAIRIPDSVTYIGEEAFYWCENLKGVIVGDGVKDIADKAFFNCTALESIVLGSSVESIGEDAFCYCDRLTSVTIPDSMKCIGKCAFEMCTEIVSVSIPKSVTEIGWGAFSECRSLVSVYYEGSQSDWDKIAIDDVNFYLNVARLYCETPEIDTALLPVDVSSGYVASNNVGKATVKTQNSKPLDIRLDRDFKFEVPSNVPLIGGGQVALDLSAVPVCAVSDGYKLRVAIGFNRDMSEDMDVSSWSSFKNFVKGHKENTEKGKELLKNATKGKIKGAMNKALNIDFYGYYEAVLKNGQIESGSGLARLKANGSMSGEWQTAVGVLPVVLKLKGTIETDSNLTLSYDGIDEKLSFQSDVTLVLPQINASAGTGIAHLADVSVYGEGKNEVIFSSQPRRLRGTLYGEIGVSVKSFFYSNQKTLFKLNKGKGWVYYDSNNKKSSSSVVETAFNETDMQIDRSYLSRQSGWADFGVKGEKAASGAGEYDAFNDITLQSDIYNGAAPKLVQTDNTLMMVWTGDVPSRSTGNHTAIYYSVYQNDSESWSTPGIVDDDGTADFYPDIATDGEKIYLVWTNAKSVLDENVTMEQLASFCEIRFAEFDKEHGIFGSFMTLSDNDTLDYAPDLFVQNGSVSAVWKNNSANKILEGGGTDTVCRAVIKDGDFTLEQIYSTDNRIYELVNCGDSVAFIMDRDGNVSSSEDAEVYVVRSGELTRITDNEFNESKLDFQSVGGDPVLTFYGNGMIYTADEESVLPLLTESEFSIESYKFIGDRLYAVLNSENSAEIYSFSQNNGLWGSPVKISYTGDYIRNASFVNTDNGIKCVFLKSEADISDETVSESSNLCMAVIPQYHDVIITDMEYYSEDVSAGTELPVTVHVLNRGTEAEDSMTLTVKKDEEVLLKKTYETSLNSGETGDLEIMIPVDETMREKSGFEVSLTSGVCTDTKTLNIGYTQLQLSAEIGIQNSSLGVLANISNNSSIGTGAALLVKNTNDGAVLETFSLDEIKPKQSISFFIDREKISSYCNDADTILLELVAYKEEEAVSDNSEILGISSVFDYFTGDVNRDGKVNINDATKIKLYLALITSFDDGQKLLADADNDGNVGVSDVTLMQMSLAGYDVNLI